MKEEEFRQSTEREQKVLAKLLELPFEGCTELRQQLDGLRVKRIDENGSLNFEVTSETRAPYERGLAVEATCPDVDSQNLSDPKIHLLLHLREGKMWMLEIYKDDSSRVKRDPDPKDFQLFSQHEFPRH